MSISTFPDTREAVRLSNVTRVYAQGKTQVRTLDGIWRDERVDRLLVKLRPGADVQGERRVMQADYADSGVIIVSPSDLSAAFGDTLNNIVVVSQVLSAPLLVTLALGIGNTLV